MSVDGVSFGGVGVSGRGVEFIPVDAGAVAHGDAVRLPCALRACLPGLLVELLDPLVGDRVPDEPRGGLGMFGPAVAPPADRLDPAHQPQPAVTAEHVADARVPRLDQVVRGRDRRRTALGRPEEREHVTLRDTPADHAPGLDQPGVLVGDGAVPVLALLPEEPGEVALPLVVGGHPCGRGVRVVHAAERHGDPPEPFAGLKPGPDAGQLGDVHAHVEQAPLHRGVRPPVAQGLEQAATPVAHDRQRRRDPGHQARPCGAGLAPGHVPADHVPAGYRDQHDRLPVQVDAVQMHHVMHLVGQRDRRPQPPHQLVATPERACGHGTLLLRVLRQQPRQRRPEVRGPPVVRARARRPARPVLAPPPGPSRRCGAVLLHRTMAHGT